MSPYLYYVVYTTLTKAEFNTIDWSDFSVKHPEVSFNFFDSTDAGELMNLLKEEPLASIFQEDSPELAQKSLKATSAIIISGTYENKTGEELNDILMEISGFLMHESMVSILDLLTLSLFAPNEWYQLQESIYSSGDLSQHTMIYCSPMDDATDNAWLHTRGMVKFGLPDLSLKDVNENEIELYYSVIIALINELAYGHQEYNQEPESKSSLQVSFTNPETNQIDAVIDLNAIFTGDEEDPDFNNYHLALQVTNLNIADHLKS